MRKTEIQKICIVIELITLVILGYILSAFVNFSYWYTWIIPVLIGLFGACCYIEGREDRE